MDILTVLNEEITALGIPYQFMEWNSEDGVLRYPYAVGELTRTPTANEDGNFESTLLITVTTRGTWAELYEIDSIIEAHFPSSGGLNVSTEKGACIIFYAGSFPVPTGEADLKRIQINLDIKEWKGLD